MSSNGDEDFGLSGTEPSANKKRKVHRACDECRKKKIRCDGAQRQGKRCTTCANLHQDCTFVSQAKKRGPPKGYVEGLEKRLAKMEELIARLAPGVNVDEELNIIENPPGQSSSGKSSPAQRNIRIAPTGELQLIRDLVDKVGPCTFQFRKEHEDEYEESSDDEATIACLPEEVRQGMENMSLGSGLERRFHGKSSGLMLVQAAQTLKKEFTSASTGEAPPPSSHRREEFWSTHEWEQDLCTPTSMPMTPDFPPEDLARELIDLFFRHFTPFLPAIHRPTFEAQYAEGLHHRVPAFTSLTLMVFAIGSKYTEDTRVYLEPGVRASAGWKYFVQLREYKRSLHGAATLTDLQCFVLAAFYLQATSAPHSAWTIIGIGIRQAQDIGCHRRKSYKAIPSVEDEQIKRVFWCLLSLDRTVSSALGRPLACQDEDFDVTFPEEVDDEYMTPAGFFQPKDTPSNLSFFNSSLKLIQIMAFALRTIYTINKSKAILGFVGPTWEQHIVSELDSAMNKWLDSVPEHLRWDPNRENQIHFEQSVALYTNYYHLQILIHRPFIPSPRKESVLSFPSLAICTNAARACSNVIESLGRRTRHVIPHVIVTAFTSSIVLLIAIWGARKANMAVSPQGQMKDVAKCIKFLQNAEKDWHAAGRLVDILRELASTGDIDIPGCGDSSARPHKRDRSDDSPISSHTTSSGSGSSPSDSPPSSRPIAGRGARPDFVEDSFQGLSRPTLTDSFSSSKWTQAGPYSIPDPYVNLPQMDESFVNNREDFISIGSFSHLFNQNNASVPELADMPLPPYSLGSSGFPSSFNPSMQEQTTSLWQDGYTMGGQPIDPSEYVATGPEVGQVLPDTLRGDTVGVWSGVPNGFGWEDWGEYLATMDGGRR